MVKNVEIGNAFKSHHWLVSLACESTSINKTVGSSSQSCDDGIVVVTDRDAV